jgi:hypothetical protein
MVHSTQNLINTGITSVPRMYQTKKNKMITGT